VTPRRRANSCMVSRCDVSIMQAVYPVRNSFGVDRRRRVGMRQQRRVHTG
jgi:hypothetical protein